MYCPKCGKWIDYQADACNECKAAQAQQTAPAYAQQPDYAPNGASASYGFYQQPQPSAPVSTEPDPTNRTYGIGKAVVSMVFGIISIFFSMFAWLYSTMVYYRAIGMVVVVLMSIALPFTIIGLIFGAKSIGCFKRRKATCAKNIPTLVLGIVGLAESAYGAFFLLMSIFMVLIAL